MKEDIKKIYEEKLMTSADAVKREESPSL